MSNENEKDLVKAGIAIGNAWMTDAIKKPKKEAMLDLALLESATLHFLAVVIANKSFSECTLKTILIADSISIVKESLELRCEELIKQKAEGRGTLSRFKEKLHLLNTEEDKK